MFYGCLAGYRSSWPDFIIYVKLSKKRRVWEMKSTWNIVHECDLDDGTPTEWALKIAENAFYWIDAMADFTFDIIDKDGETVLKKCQSLVSAKRWVTMNLL